MKSKHQSPPKLALRFLLWFIKGELAEEVSGDLEEKYQLKLEQTTAFKAKWAYWHQVMQYLRPFAIRSNITTHLNPLFMLPHHLKISLRSLRKNKGFTIINISGLALGMAVAILIGLWVNDELNFNRYHENYDRIAHIMQHRTIGEERLTQWSSQLPLAEELRTRYGHDFERVSTTTFYRERVFTYQNESFAKSGYYMDEDGPSILSLRMSRGKVTDLNTPEAIFISESFAKGLFEEENPIGKALKLGEEASATITGVFEDLPANSNYSDADFFGAMDLYLSANSWMKTMPNPWGYSGFSTLVQLSPHVNLESQNAKIKDVILDKVAHDETALRKQPLTFLHPMSKWRLYARFENGVNTGGDIENVRLYGFIGLITLLLACINFMNLSTARSEKRAREVGVRKAIGSGRHQLRRQFLSESLIVSGLAFVFALLLAVLLLPTFNDITDKSLSIGWGNIQFWGIGLALTIGTGLMAGSYPAFYLASFNVVRALKGSFRIGRSAATPRKILVVAQFSVSIILIIGTIIIYQQIQHGQNRSVGYEQGDLVTIYPKSGDIGNNFDLIQHELLQKNVVESITKSSSPVTATWGSWGNWNWRDKDPELYVSFSKIDITQNYGKTVGWKFRKGRDFSNDFKTDTAAFVINEAAAKFIGFTNPIGESVLLEDKPYEIIGVIEDMLTGSPYQSTDPVFYSLNPNRGDILILRLKPNASANETIGQVKTVIEGYDPTAVVEFKFVDDEFARKFRKEQRRGKLAAAFAIITIFISCLGLFGLSAYMAEQRTKEIGVRKVLGASVNQLWQLLSKDFIVLVLIACLFAIPISYYFSNNWLQAYDYRINIAWWVFAMAISGALLVTMLTVSFQAIKAAVANPLKSLRSE